MLSTLLQVLIPAVLIRSWGDYGYALVISAQGLAAYVGVADLGLQATLLHRLAVLVTRGSLSEARSVARSGLIVLAGFSALAAVVVVGFAFATQTVIWEPIATAAGSSLTTTLLALSATAISTASAVSLGGWSTAVEYARGRYVLVQAAPLLRNLGTVVALLVAAALRVSPAWALVASACFGVPLDIGRFALSVRFLEGATDPRLPLRTLIWQSRGGPVYAFGIATSNGLLPAAVGVFAPTVASAAVPGRTISNGARLVANTVGNAIWVPLAARLEALKDRPEAQRSLAQRTSLLLAIIQCASLAGIILVAPVLVPIWLPSKAQLILGAMPAFLLEQAVLILAVPAQIRLMAAGRFMAVGVVTLTGALAVMGTMSILIPRMGVVGYAASVAFASAAIVVPALLVLERQEERAAGGNSRPTTRLILAGCALIVVSTGFASAMLSAVLAVPLLLACVVIAWRLRRSLVPRPLDTAKSRG